MKVAIAGAFGFIGENLIHHLLAQTDYELIALSRQARSSDELRVSCVTADLFSLKEAKVALKGADVAIYLVHSMAPSSRLTQASFRDLDYLLADNFARAARHQGVKKIVYVGGVIPANCTTLSQHLESRFEVEEVIRSQNIPVITLRCGMVIGPRGSSYQIMVRLVERLPLMILPQWMRTLSAPVFVDDLSKVILYSIRECVSEHVIYDVGIDCAVSYKEILVQTAKIRKRSPVFIDVPYVSPHLSKLWIRLVSGTPKGLVYPLVDSVTHEMLKDPTHRVPDHWDLKLTPLGDAIKKSLTNQKSFTTQRLATQIRGLSEVRSVQRMPLNKSLNARLVGLYYTEWLARLFWPLIKCKKIGTKYEFLLRFLSIKLLTLEIDEKLSSDSRFLFRVGPGLLVSSYNRARFEFRESYNRRFLVVALHNFRPALPWFIYRFTQAPLHQFIMGRFASHLGNDRWGQQDV